MSEHTLTRQRQAEGVSAPLIAALERAWGQIRERHPQVPPAVLITGSGSEGQRRDELRLGHFAAGRWQAHQADGQLPEIFIGGEGLQRGGAAVLATLLHEAAHALADVRAIKDTSRQGRYHNRRFKALGEELGLHLDQAPGIGWSSTTLPENTTARYAETITALDQAITVVRRREGRATSQPQPGPPPCLCACPRRIRVAPGVLAAGPIICAVCNEPFRPTTQEPA